MALSIRDEVGPFTRKAGNIRITPVTHKGLLTWNKNVARIGIIIISAKAERIDIDKPQV